MCPAWPQGYSQVRIGAPGPDGAHNFLKSRRNGSVGVEVSAQGQPMPLDSLTLEGRDVPCLAPGALAGPYWGPWARLSHRGCPGLWIPMYLKGLMCPAWPQGHSQVHILRLLKVAKLQILHFCMGF